MSRPWIRGAPLPPRLPDDDDLDDMEKDSSAKGHKQLLCKRKRLRFVPSTTWIHPQHPLFVTAKMKWRRASWWQRLGVFVLLIAAGWTVARISHKVYGRIFPVNNPPPYRRLDFLVAGFPKTGTTSLLFALAQHPDVVMDNAEYCHIARPLQQDDVNANRLNKYLNNLVKEHEKKNNHNSYKRAPLVGLKCPEALKNFKAIHRLSQHSPHAKWIIGLRHPVWFVQSFYNYRVLEAHLRPKSDGNGQNEHIPTLHELWENHTLSFRDLNADTARFDTQLQQLAKTSLNVTQLQAFIGHGMWAIKPNSFSIFLYTMEQLQDDNLQRKKDFQNDLVAFLGLDPLPHDVGHANQNKVSADEQSKTVPEMIHICATAFADIRATLIAQGQQAADWILNQFLAVPDVHVSNRAHFAAALQAWGTDPCHVDGKEH